MFFHCHKAFYSFLSKETKLQFYIWKRQTILEINSWPTWNKSTFCILFAWLPTSSRNSCERSSATRYHSMSISIYRWSPEFLSMPSFISSRTWTCVFNCIFLIYFPLNYCFRLGLHRVRSVEETSTYKSYWLLDMCMTKGNRLRHIICYGNRSFFPFGEIQFQKLVFPNLTLIVVLCTSANNTNSNSNS